MAVSEEDRERGRRLRSAREAAGFSTMQEAADYFGWSVNTLKAHEAGSRGLKLHAARKYAKAFNVDVQRLIIPQRGDGDAWEGNSIVAIPVYGEAAAGVWREGPDQPLSSAPEIPAMQARTYRPDMQYARLCVGESVNRRIRDGEYAVCVKLEGYPGGFRDNDLVDVARYRNGVREHTLKVFRDRDGRQWLECDSDNGKYGRQAIPLEVAEDGTLIEIQGVVIGATRVF